jgi:hypothetical protein
VSLECDVRQKPKAIKSIKPISYVSKKYDNFMELRFK